MKLSYTTWTAFSGLTLSLALLSGCNHEEAAPEAPAATAPEAAVAPGAETPATTPAEPGPAVEAPKSAEPAPEEPKAAEPAPAEAK